MENITIRNVDDEVNSGLRVRDSGNGRSMEKEARRILHAAVVHKPHVCNLAAALRARIEPLGGMDLELLPREAGREPPSFD